jgi:hypothetical protein
MNSKIRAYQRYLQQSINDYLEKKRLYETLPLFAAQWTDEDQTALDIYEGNLSQFNGIFVEDDGE